MSRSIAIWRIGSAIAVMACASLAAAGEKPATPADPRELPSYMIPNIPDSAEAYYSPDSKYLIAQTRDPAALKTLRGGEGALTYIFSDDGKEIWRVNDRGQDACSYFFQIGRAHV
jgi:hypothetical protein